MQGSCCCQSGKDKPQSAPQGNAGPLRELTPLRPQPVDRLRYFGTGALVFAIWTGCYLVIEPLARLLTQAVPGLSDRAAAALEFFLYDTAKILLLLLLMVYVIGWLRAGLHVERVRDFLAGRRRVLGYVLGAGFGAITPFCSCSSIPLFLGFTTSGIPVGITLAFLITSPLINEIAVVLLWGLLGWKLTLVYVLAGLGAGIIGGWFMDVLRAERWLQDYLKESIASGAAQRPAGAEQRKMGLRERHLFASGETRSIFRRVWRWVIIGVGAGGPAARLCAGSLVRRASGRGAMVVCPGCGGCGHPALHQRHGYRARHGEPAAQGPARGHHTGLLHERRGGQPAGSAHAAAGHARQAAGPLSGDAAGALFPAGLAAQRGTGLAAVGYGNVDFNTMNKVNEPYALQPNKQ